MSEIIRTVRHTFRGHETMEGAGVRLRRMFGNAEVPLLDPFLLLDNFGSNNPADYLAGFPWHPHRGIETVTYMLNGKTAHEDSLGNKGVIGSGDVQWMSAGSGILHQEMPQRTEGTLSGFQLWVNLPRDQKLETPSYRGVESRDIPIVHGGDGRAVRIVAGEHEGVVGPVRHIPVDPLYLDVTIPADAEFELPIKRGHTAFAQAIEGDAEFDGSTSKGSRATATSSTKEEGGPAVEHRGGPGTTMVYGDGDRVRIRAGPSGTRFLLGAGRPLHEPVAWYGPIVMNTQAEIAEAISDLRSGTFVRSRKVINES